MISGRVDCDTELNDRLNEELVAFNTAITGVSERGGFSVLLGQFAEVRCVVACVGRWCS
jgi:hypothetical protein